MTATPYWPGGAAELPTNTDPELEVDFAQHQRRWTVLLRLLLAIPQTIVLAIAGIGSAVVATICWIVALFTGRLPDWAVQFLTGFTSWQMRLTGYLMLLTDRYPPFSFTALGYPIRSAFPTPGKLNRLAVLFRIILLIPAMIVSSLVTYGWFVAGFVLWLIVLALGRMPAALFLATSATLRYQLRYQSYAVMLTSAYPKKLFGYAEARPGPVAGTPVTRPLVLTKAARVLIIVLAMVAYGAQVAEEKANLQQLQMTSASHA